MLNRRRFLTATAGFAAGGLVMPYAQAAGALAGIDLAAMRGSINASDLGVHPGAFDDQSKAFSKMLAKAAGTDTPVFMPPGTYTISNITLPARVRLSGVPGATRLVYAGDGHLLAAENAEHIELTGLVLDGANRWLGDNAQGIVDLRGVAHFVLDNCRVIGAGKNGIALERVSGRIERSEISGAADAGIWSVDSGRLRITGNSVSDCGNGGILVHRWQPAEDGTIVSGNRVERILARNGGTGQFGNGINVFRAGNVIVSGNQVADCAFSAIRSNSGSNIQISGNTCLRSGETALYSEFAFEGAVISGNIVDGAANGISVVNFNAGGRMSAVSANLVRNLSETGPYPADAPGFGVGITVEADASLTGNVIENAPRYGMHLGWGPFLRNVVATGNVIRNAGEGIAVSVVEGSGSAVISDNVFDATPRGAVVGHRWSEAVTGDLTIDGAAVFPGLTVERNRVS
ncbi:MAG: TIGR03808 family TAT-translocated repetitive protein [Mesorhizobium sp.]|nr:TIGR03808 family TAT-translocated repetitive protein [Mesorhizobium sp.]